MLRSWDGYLYFVVGKQRTGAAVGAGGVGPGRVCASRATVLLALSLPSLALERRHSEFVTVAVNETVDDSLLVTGNTVRMDGVVNGDLVGFRPDSMSGTVMGDLLSWAPEDGGPRHRGGSHLHLLAIARRRWASWLRYLRLGAIAAH